MVYVWWVRCDGCVREGVLQGGVRNRLKSVDDKIYDLPYFLKNKNQAGKKVFRK